MFVPIRVKVVKYCACEKIHTEVLGSIPKPFSIRIFSVIARTIIGKMWVHIGTSILNYLPFERIRGDVIFTDPDYHNDYLRDHYFKQHLIL